ncbi:hypothetical protein L3556_09175 [Candidatus Synechococcus calcipolaris G9]|uniref:Uncharacterized protein n=1 Tax=Candidatus Synechococcus calcipolaris G9 TaxID=1497997 RepID=A0ABT6EZT8_9SYNE|nr:hypothetical protein [Candidatus Synechococcus calcipolaris]MDG2991095.1 hypothetical protein [Candidatus Synechococcus calcipolaris G9]
MANSQNPTQTERNPDVSPPSQPEVGEPLTMDAVPDQVLATLFDLQLLETLILPELPDIESLFADIPPLVLLEMAPFLALSEEDWAQMQASYGRLEEHLHQTLTYLAKVKAIAYQLQAVASEFAPPRRRRQPQPPHPLEHLSSELLRAIAQTQAVLEPVYPSLQDLGQYLDPDPQEK